MPSNHLILCCPLLPVYLEIEKAIKKLEKSLGKMQGSLKTGDAVLGSAAQSCPALCDPMDCSPPGSSVRILQAGMLEWAAMSSPPGDLSYSRIKPGSPALHVDSVPAELPRKPPKWGSVQFSSVAQSCPTLRDPMNYSTPGLPVHHQLLELTQIHVYRVGDAI